MKNTNKPKENINIKGKPGKGKMIKNMLTRRSTLKLK